MPEYEQWVEDTHDANKWVAKYYKVCGLLQMLVYDIHSLLGFGNK